MAQTEMSPIAITWLNGPHTIDLDQDWRSRASGADLLDNVRAQLPSPSCPEGRPRLTGMTIDQIVELGQLVTEARAEREAAVPDIVEVRTTHFCTTWSAGALTRLSGDVTWLDSRATRQEIVDELYQVLQPPAVSDPDTPAQQRLSTYLKGYQQ